MRNVGGYPCFSSSVQRASPKCRIVIGFRVVQIGAIRRLKHSHSSVARDLHLLPAGTRYLPYFAPPGSCREEVDPLAVAGPTGDCAGCCVLGEASGRAAGCANDVYIETSLP